MKPVNNPKLPIKKPGIYSGVPLSVYHSDAFTPSMSVSSSNLRTAWSKSPAHMFAKWAHNPNRIEDGGDETKWMRFGRAAHHLFLGEDDFSTQFVMQPGQYSDAKTGEIKPWSNNANVCRAWHGQQRDAGRTVLTQNELDKVLPMVANLKLDPLVSSGALRGLVEHSMVAQDNETGLWLKSRPDVIPHDGDYVDLKMTSDVTDLAIMGSLKNFGYHMQGGLVWEVCEQLGLPFTSFTLLLIETEPPYCVRAVPLTDDDLSRGRLQCRAMLRLTRACIDKGHWPGPGEGELRPIPLGTAERVSIDARLAVLEKQAGEGS